MKETVELLSQRFDYVIVDSPPVLGVADALILSTVAKAVIVVVRAGHTPREMIQRALKGLIELNATVLGTVLNNLDIRGNGYPYYYNYYYQSPSNPSAEPHPGEREVADDFPLVRRGAGSNKPA